MTKAPRADGGPTLLECVLNHVFERVRDGDRSRKDSAAGFTLIEVIVVIAVIGIIAAFTAAGFKNFYHYSALKAARNEVYQALTDARNRTLASENDTVYGVQVGTSSVTRFVGDTFIQGAATNEVYVFEGGVTATGTQVTSGAHFIFQRLTGKPSATGTLSIRNDDGTATRTVTVHTSGLIE